MKKYAKIVNEEKGLVTVGIGTKEEYYKSLGMEEMDVEQGADGKWYIAGKAPAPPQEEVLKEYETAVQAHLDETAQSRGYDNTYTCLSYLSSTDETWKRESNAFNAWRDSVWRKCHEILNAVMAGTIQPPSIAELIAQLPAIDWNDPQTE